jgi:plastocyanin
MTDWDLLTPGIGLTTIGIVGVGISLAGIAKTFIDGMHAVSLLTMFIGMIFLASGLFKDGFPSSGRAKSATFITLGFLVTFGVAAAVTVSTQVTTIFAYIGLMTIISVPAAVLSVVSYRRPQYVKALGVIFIAGAAVAGITFYAFGLVAPKAPEPVEEEAPAPAEPETPAAPANIVKAKILAGASSPENPDYEPDPVVVAKGDGVEWTNEDNAIHTVTSEQAGLFDSDFINAGKTFLLDTSTLDVGDYEYFCTLHTFMTGTLRVTEPGATSGGEAAPESAPGETSGEETVAATVTGVSIVLGSSAPTNGQFFVPDTVTTTVGSMVTWTNDDTALHTVTSGTVEGSKATPDGVFDSKFMKSGASFSYVFEAPGEYSYYCSLHPYMTGKVTVN